MPDEMNIGVEGHFDGDWLACRCGRRIALGVVASRVDARVGPCRACRRWVKVPQTEPVKGKRQARATSPA